MENGLSLPDISLLEPLAETLEIAKTNLPMLLFRFFCLMAVILGGMFVPVYVASRKYK